MRYMDFDSGELWTLDEIKDIYYANDEDFQVYASFDDYLNYLLLLGKQRIGGLIEVDD